MGNSNNEQYRNIVDTSLIAVNSDDRLPSSLLTLDEYRQCLAIAQECNLNKKDGQDIKKLSITNPEHPFHPLYQYLQTIAQAMKGSEFDHHCVICGEKLSARTHYPYCTACGRLAYRGIIRGKSRTRGYRNFGKICVVCNEKPAMTAGMCRACYRIGDRRGIHDPEKIRLIRQSFNKPKTKAAALNDAFQEASGKGKFQTGLVPKVWDI